VSEPVVDPTLVDLGKLSEWMDAQGLPRGELRDLALLGGGTQNILLRFTRGGESYVLRRPPAHPRKNSDETMRREARVLGALAGSDVPHPRLIAACSQTDVLGVAFYLMEPVRGFNPTTGLPEPHRSDAALRRAMGFAMVDGIVALGRIDYQAVGLSDFGRPQGYLERQVERWRAQLDGYNELSGYPGPQIPGLEEVAAWLSERRPINWQPGILHGDYHLANVLFSYDGPELAAIVDWELSTIGDPLLDLGWLIATWPDGDGAAAPAIGAGIGDGLPRSDELVEHYRAHSARDLTHVDWYAVLACYKLGIILEGTHARAFAGKAPKDIGDALHATTLGLFARALKIIEGV